MSDVNQLKEKIISYIRRTGPVLPVQISREIDMSMIFAGAILSELVSTKQLKISTAKIGGSPVYYIPGQEAQLSKLYDALPMREKEAYTLLESKKVLKDKEVPPAIRVALAEIKDFAVPTQVQTKNGEELVWRWHLTDPKEVTTKPVQQKAVSQKKETGVQQATLVQKKRPVKQVMPKNDEFMEYVQRYLKHKNITVLSQEMIRKNREAHFEIQVPSNVGPMNLFVTAKNKKKISEADLSLAYHKGQSKKLPLLFLSTGELTKKAKGYQEKNLKGYVIFKKIP